MLHFLFHRQQTIHLFIVGFNCFDIHFATMSIAKKDKTEKRRGKKKRRKKKDWKKKGRIKQKKKVTICFETFFFLLSFTFAFAFAFAVAVVFASFLLLLLLFLFRTLASILDSVDVDKNVKKQKKKKKMEENGENWTMDDYNKIRLIFFPPFSCLFPFKDEQLVHFQWFVMSREFDSLTFMNYTKIPYHLPFKVNIFFLFLVFCFFSRFLSIFVLFC